MPPKFRKKKFAPTTSIKSANVSNATFLIIVESPSKCAKIEHYLGTEYCCIASMGHLRQIVGLKSIDTKDTFLPTFTLIDEKKDHIAKMKTVISNFSHKNVFLATDDDREGEAIAWHICEIFNLPLDTPRILFHEITKQAIQHAIKTPTITNMSVVMAQQARQILDVIVGYKISPFLWKYLYNNKENSLSAGRCQTPALKLIYENEKEKETENIIKIYKTTGIFSDRQFKFDLNHHFEDEEETDVFLQKSILFAHRLSVGSQKTVTRTPPKPLHTSRLLQTASNQLQMSPKETMALCQQLYQNGYITYMRTENDSYSNEFLTKISNYITSQFNSDEYVGDLSLVGNSNSENPHEAIRATQIELKTLPNCENKRMVSLYKMIWRITMESCMSIAKYQQTKITVTAPLKHEYGMDLDMPIFLGWKIIQSKLDITEEQTKCTSDLLYLKSLSNATNSISYQTISSNLHIKNKHSYYTEASLVNKLESLGIGRPSTYATIIETIKERGYVKKMDTDGYVYKCCDYELTNKTIHKNVQERVFGVEKNKLIIQSVGILALEFLIQYFDPMFSYEYTKGMEEKLDLISSNKITAWENICKDCYQQIKLLSSDVKNVQKKTYEVEPGYEFLFEKYGPVIKHTLDDGGIEYLPGNKELDINIEKLQRKEYQLSDLVAVSPQCLGEYQEQSLYLKNGQYGYYVEWGDRKESVKSLNLPFNEINIDNVVPWLESKTANKSKDILRELNENMCIRKGQYGAYVFYKRNDMKKPKFLNIKKCPHGYLNCEVDVLVEWLCKEYNLPSP